ncbi:MAG: hypothetical protein R3244_07945 [Thermoanaerobaculia bacterium]|nr:hypothetical protein [Thermoanaerobaculia bacterium]
MKTTHLLTTDEPVEALAPLIAAAEAAGLRIGWLDLEASAEPPATLAGAVEAGVFRTVARSETGLVTAKRVAGPLVLRDLLREHFLGCRLVLVRGEVDAPRLTRRGERWLVASEAGRLELGTDDLVARLRRPAVTFLSS